MFLRQDLDELIASEAQPAVSLYLPTHVAGREIRQDPIRLKNLRAQTADRLHAEWRRSEVASFLAPTDSIVADDDFLAPSRRRFGGFFGARLQPHP